MHTLPANAEEVRIRNSENNSDYYFRLRTDRLTSFFQYLMANRHAESPVSAMPGISGAAHYGLDCIFFGPKPPRFPARDILAFLLTRHEEWTRAGRALAYPAITLAEVEDALGQWAGTVTQLLADGAERA